MQNDKNTATIFKTAGGHEFARVKSDEPGAAKRVETLLDVCASAAGDTQIIVVDLDMGESGGNDRNRIR
jgi:vacuolar-type H+-ATPase subunit F/Vma7